MLWFNSIDSATGRYWGSGLIDLIRFGNGPISRLWCDSIDRLIELFWWRASVGCRRSGVSLVSTKNPCLSPFVYPSELLWLLALAFAPAWTPLWVTTLWWSRSTLVPYHLYIQASYSGFLLWLIALAWTPLLGHYAVILVRIVYCDTGWRKSLLILMLEPWALQGLLETHHLLGQYQW